MPSIAALLTTLGVIGAVSLGLTPGPAHAGKSSPKVRIVGKQFVVHPQISTQRTSNPSGSAPRSGQAATMSR